MTFPILKQGLLALSIIMAVSGCLGSKKSLGSADEAMRLDEFYALISPERLKMAIKPFPPGSDVAEQRIFLLDFERRKVPIRFFGRRTGIVVEFLPGTFLPFPIYGALLPEPNGAALYLDMNDLRRAHTGAADVEPFARAAWPKIRHLVTWVKQDGQQGYLRPNDLDAVISIYTALRDAGMEPTTTYPLTEEN